MKRVIRAAKKSSELAEIRHFDTVQAFCAIECSVEYIPVLCGPHGRSDWGYAMKSTPVR